jgi:hypothetical protein
MERIRTPDGKIRPLQEGEGGVRELPDPFSPVDCSQIFPFAFVNGSCNNLDVPNLGAAGLPLLQHGPRIYLDGRGELDDIGRPSARVVSNEVVRQTAIDVNVKQASRLLIFFGQFIDHDFALTLENEEEEAPVEVEEDDPIFGEDGEMRFPRSFFSLNNDFQRTFVDELSSFLDLTQVYGNSEERLALIRTFENGLMNTSIQVGNEEFPPEDPMNPGGFICGDIRCTENTQLFGFHTIFLREHNRQARIVAEQLGPNATDEEIFQRARLRNIAQYQSAIWDFYLPYLLGRRSFFDLTGEYEQYYPETDPTVSNIFNSAVYRYGHSGVSENLDFRTASLQNFRNPIALRTAFEGPQLIFQSSADIDALFIGQSTIGHDVLDAQCVDSIRDFLFTNVDGIGFDLISRNIQRGRDHGLNTFNFYREVFGLEPYECPENNQLQCFEELVQDPELAETLFDLYGEFDRIDPWIAGMAEVPVLYPDSLLGDTFTVIMADQFQRLREGDRLWYENLIDNFTDIQFPVRLATIIGNNINNLNLPFFNAMMLENPYEAYSTDTELQVEWFTPPEIDGNVEDFTVEITANGNTMTVTVPEDELWYQFTDASPNTDYEIRVTANLMNGGEEDLGTTTISTGQPGRRNNIFNNPNTYIIGGSIIGGIAVLSVVGVFVVKRRSSSTSSGGISDPAFF